MSNKKYNTNQKINVIQLIVTLQKNPSENYYFNLETLIQIIFSGK